MEGAVEEKVLELLTAMPALESVVLKGNEFYDTKRIKELFRARFEEIGKPNAIKTYVHPFMEQKWKKSFFTQEDFSKRKTNQKIFQKNLKIPFFNHVLQKQK